MKFQFDQITSKDVHFSRKDSPLMGGQSPFKWEMKEWGENSKLNRTVNYEGLPKK